MDKFKLLAFFRAVIDLAINMEPNKYGSPVSYLVEELVLYQEAFLARLLKDRDHSVEVRINGAGLKMYFNIKRKRIYIGGDQKDLYPEFVEKVERLIRKHGLTGILWNNRIGGAYGR